MVQIPYYSGGAVTKALTFNKDTGNQFLKTQGVRVSESLRLRKGDAVSSDEVVQTLGLPVFVKPNDGGSSVATTKVKTKAQLQPAIDSAFREGEEVIIERFIPGVEVTCGCYCVRNELVMFPLTEVVTENEFFDYGAKYKGEVLEITPARISDALTQQIQQETARIYRLIGAKGIIRVDFIIPSGETPVMLEINTTPGMTTTSFIPQQVRAAGLSMTNVITDIIENI